MIKRTVFMMLVAMLGCQAASADDGVSAGTVYERWPSSLGYYSNTEGGVGLSWQRWFGDFGLAFAAGGLYEPDAGSPASTSTLVLDYNAQARLSWLLYATDFSPWMSNNLQAVAYLAHRGIIALEFDRYDETTFETFYTRLPFLAEFMLGAGVSIESTLFGHFSQSIDFMYVGKWPLELAVAGGWSFRYRY